MTRSGFKVLWKKRELVIRKTGLKGRHSAGCNSYKQGRTVVGAAWKVVGSLGCIDREMVELRILRGGSNANGRITTLNFRRADFGLCRDLFGRIPQGRVLESRGGSRDIQGSPPP